MIYIVATEREKVCKWVRWKCCETIHNNKAASLLSLPLCAASEIWWPSQARWMTVATKKNPYVLDFSVCMQQQKKKDIFFVQLKQELAQVVKTDIKMVMVETKD